MNMTKYNAARSKATIITDNRAMRVASSPNYNILKDNTITTDPICINLRRMAMIYT